MSDLLARADICVIGLERSEYPARWRSAAHWLRSRNTEWLIAGWPSRMLLNRGHIGRKSYRLARANANWNWAKGTRLLPSWITRYWANTALPRSLGPCVVPHTYVGSLTFSSTGCWQVLLNLCLEIEYRLATCRSPFRLLPTVVQINLSNLEIDISKVGFIIGLWILGPWQVLRSVYKHARGYPVHPRILWYVMYISSTLSFEDAYWHTVYINARNQESLTASSIPILEEVSKTTSFPRVYFAVCREGCLTSKVWPWTLIARIWLINEKCDRQREPPQKSWTRWAQND